VMHFFLLLLNIFLFGINNISRFKSVKDEIKMRIYKRLLSIRIFEGLFFAFLIG